MIFIKIKNRHKRYVTCDDVVEMAVIALRNELRSAQCGCSALIVGGFDYAAHLPNKKTTTKYGGCYFGGDGGNRNRVRSRIAKGSTSVVCHLGFPSHIGGKQPMCYGSL